MLARHAAPVREAGVPVNRCRDMLLPNSSDNANIPQRTGPDPPVFGASALAPTLHDPQRPSVSFLYMIN